MRCRNGQESCEYTADILQRIWKQTHIVFLTYILYWNLYRTGSVYIFIQLSVKCTTTSVKQKCNAYYHKGRYVSVFEYQADSSIRILKGMVQFSNRKKQLMPTLFGYNKLRHCLEKLCFYFIKTPIALSINSRLSLFLHSMSHVLQGCAYTDHTMQ
mmetsp:Transcript_338/g.625  ORF Transcript_338/g.625 Transcript_338/m.625 type:complete len:156 (-) Transcript_338:270-737(-)